MGLRSVGGKLLAVAGKLVDACCCRVRRYACVTVGVDSCGHSLVECQQVDSGGVYYTSDCDGLCPLPPACECDPPCDGCSECVNGECQPTYGECEQCVNGSVQPKCGECETCVNGTCIPCPDGYECIDGVCGPPPGTYYCCYEYTSSGSASDPTAGVSGTYCFNGPCGEMIDNTFVPQAWRTAGGPYTSATACADNCRTHACNTDECGNRSCDPDAAGAFVTKEQCRQACAESSTGTCALGPSDPFTASGVGGGVQSFYFSVDPAAFSSGREICVSYVSTNARPIRVQIWSPDMSSSGCSQIADRTIKGDSGWRGKELCNCKFNAPGGFKGDPKGFVKWRTKQKGVTTFEVQVRTECADNAWEIGVTCGPCVPLPDAVCQCACGVIVNNECCEYPFGIGDPVNVDFELVAQALITIEWCNLTGSPYSLDFQPSGEIKSIERSRVASETIIACGKTEQGVSQLYGTFVVGYSSPTLDIPQCSTSRWYQWTYQLDPASPTGGSATVSVVRETGWGCGPCQEDPVVTVTLPCA